MNKPYGSLFVELTEDIDSGMRVRATGENHTGLYPKVEKALNKVKAWFGITLEGGKEGDIVPVYPPYSGTVMARVLADVNPVRTGDWVYTDSSGYFTTTTGTGRIPTAIIVTPLMNEAPAPNKIVKAMVFVGRYLYDGGGYQP